MGVSGYAGYYKLIHQQPGFRSTSMPLSCHPERSYALDDEISLTRALSYGEHHIICNTRTFIICSDCEIINSYWTV